MIPSLLLMSYILWQKLGHKL